MDINEAVAAELRAERSALTPKVSVDALALKSGVPKRTLVRMLKAERNINVVMLRAIAQGLGVEPAEIMRRAERRMSNASDYVDQEAVARDVSAL